MLRFRVCVRRFLPGKLVFFADPFFLGILQSIFGSELWFSVGVLVFVLVGTVFAHVFGHFCGMGFRKVVGKILLVSGLPFLSLSLLALLLFLSFFLGAGRDGGSSSVPLFLLALQAPLASGRGLGFSLSLAPLSAFLCSPLPPPAAAGLPSFSFFLSLRLSLCIFVLCLFPSSVSCV